MKRAIESAGARYSGREDALHPALVAAFLPIARALVDHGITAVQVQSAISHAFVVAARDIARLKNGKVNQSRVAIVTGYSRTEIRKVLSGIRESIDGEKSFGGRKILDGWARDPEYSSRTGIRRPLPVRGNYGSFYSLAKKYSGDIPAKAALDELLRTGQVELRRNMVHMVKSVKALEKKRAAAIAVFAERLKRVCDESGSGQLQGSATTTDVLQFEFDNESSLVISSERARQSARAFMNGMLASLTPMTRKPQRSSAKRGSQLKLMVSISTREFSQ